jgi:hypothetical protein
MARCCLPKDRRGICYYCCCCFCCCRSLEKVFRVCFPKGAPGSCVIFTLVFICMSALFSGVMWMNQSASRKQVDIVYGYYVTELETNIKRASEELLDSLRRPAKGLQAMEPSLVYGTLPTNSTLDPSVMIRMFNSFTYSDPSSAGYEQLESMSVIFPKGASSSAADTWTLAKEGHLCADYVYHVADGTTAGTEYGYCAHRNGSVLYGSAVDTGPAPELSDLDRAVLNGSLAETFLPVKPRFGTFALAYETGCTLPGQDDVYAITRSEKKLCQLDDFMANLYVAEDGVAYIIETYTGYLVSSTVKNETVADGKRVNCTQANDPLIRKSALYLEKHAQGVNMSWYHFRRQESIHEDGMIMVARRVYAEGIDWVIVLAIAEKDFFGKIYRSKDHSLIFFAAMTVISLALVVISTNLCFSKPLRKLVLGLRTRSQRNPDSIGAGEESFCVREFTETEEDYDRLAPESREASEGHEFVDIK